VIDHFGIICADYAKSKEYYDTVLGVLGHTRQMDVGPAIG
jgi:catechol 2,3-dioxygenase-like lactoylglutathione lyase family enzyme